MSDSEATVVSGATVPLSGEGPETPVSHVEAARVRDSDPSAAFAPTGASAEREFLAERLALFARIACLASSGFLVMRLVLNALWNLERFPAFHLAATAIFLVAWVLAGLRTLSDRGLRLLDAAGTIAAALFYAMMIPTMSVAWRPDQLVLLIANAVLLGRAALVPSEPRRTAWISVASVAAIPVATRFLFERTGPQGLVPGAVVIQATLWSAFTVVLATLISNVTFHLRRSIARARRLGQYTLLEKIGEGGMGAVYRAEHEMLRRPTAISFWPPTARGKRRSAASSARRSSRRASRIPTPSRCTTSGAPRSAPSIM